MNIRTICIPVAKIRLTLKRAIVVGVKVAADEPTLEPSRPHAAAEDAIACTLAVKLTDRDL